MSSWVMAFVSCASPPCSTVDGPSGLGALSSSAMCVAAFAIGKKAASPGIAFTALTRFRHPDDFALDDSFPDVSTIMRQRETKSFQKRLNFEKRMRIIFSRTLRRRFRDKTLYDPAMIWDEAESNLAEDIFKYVHAHDECDEAMILKALRETNPQINENTFKNVWERLQK